MDQRKSSVNWIEAYMDWTNADSWTFGANRLAGDGIGEVGVDASREFAEAYLDWMDAWQPLREANPRYHATASSSCPAAIDDCISGLDEFWDAIMVALHTDSDCVPFLSQIIDADDAIQRTAIPA